MRFETLPSQKNRNFVVNYCNTDRSLDSKPAQTSVGYAFSFNEVQLELSETGLANHVWGYCPKESWQATNAEPPQATPGELRVVPDSPFVPGVTIGASKTRLPVFYNEHSRWLCIGNPSASGGFQIKLAPGLIVVGELSLMIALWVQVNQFDS